MKKTLYVVFLWLEFSWGVNWAQFVLPQAKAYLAIASSLALRVYFRRMENPELNVTTTSVIIHTIWYRAKDLILGGKQKCHTGVGQNLKLCPTIFLDSVRLVFLLPKPSHWMTLGESWRVAGCDMKWFPPQRFASFVPFASFWMWRKWQPWGIQLMQRHRPQLHFSLKSIVPCTLRFRKM